MQGGPHAVPGAPGRTRTADAGLRTASLYPLSYGGARPMVPEGRPAAGWAGHPRTGDFGRRATPRLEFRPMDAGHPPLELILYSRAGCHLCDEARTILEGLLAQRRAAGLAAPDLVERDIATDPDWERAFFTTIPVVELGGRRLELVTSAAKLKALLATLDERPVSTPPRHDRPAAGRDLRSGST